MKTTLALAIMAAALGLSINTYAAINTHSDILSTTQQRVQQNHDYDQAIQTVNYNNHKITLNKNDLVRATSFDLTPEEYGQYKYLMKFTPRGVWTPDIDPVIALGVSAKTERERMKYAELAFQQRTKREAKEIAFSVSMMKVEREHDPDSPRWMTWEQKKEFALKGTSAMDDSPKNTDTKTENVMVFVNPQSCLKSTTCINSMNNAMKAKLDNTNLTFYAVYPHSTGHSAKTLSMFKQKLNADYINPSITFTAIDESKLAHNHPQLPFVLIQGNGGNKIVRLNQA